MIHKFFRTALAAVILLAATEVRGTPVPADNIAPAHNGLRLPATFRGDLPCADCEAIRYQIDLWPDQFFQLRRQWIGKTRSDGTPLVVDQIGQWRPDAARQAIILYSGAETPLQFEVKGPYRLRALDMQGQPIVSDLPYELTSNGTLEPAVMSLILGGEVQYMADAALFTECFTDRRYPVAIEADFVSLERAYRDAAVDPGAPLYVTFEGSILPRPKVDGDARVPTVVVQRFIGAWPAERCERAKADAALTNTYWRIARLADTPVAALPPHREPHLMLRDTDGLDRFSATVGCNQLIGEFDVKDDTIGFSPAASTLMACPPPLADLEAKLGQAIAAARTWRIKANTLELLDNSGATVALFEAVYF